MKLLQKIKSMNKRDVVTLCVSAVLTFAVFTGVKGILPNVSTNIASNDPVVKTQVTLAAVGALMMLPANEAPTIFNVEDSATLKAQQGFFAGAENGDVLLVYPQSAKAIIYSPSKNVIVNAGPLSFDQAK